jgi:hypothetical protein
MATKQFINNTGYNLRVTLVVRSWVHVGTTAEVVVVDVPVGATVSGQWASSLNPYLDAVLVDVLDRPDLGQAAVRVAARDDAVDIDINTHNMAILEMGAQGVVMYFRNSKPRRGS